MHEIVKKLLSCWDFEFFLNICVAPRFQSRSRTKIYPMIFFYIMLLWLFWNNENLTNLVKQHINCQICSMPGFHTQEKICAKRFHSQNNSLLLESRCRTIFCGWIPCAEQFSDAGFHTQEKISAPRFHSQNNSLLLESRCRTIFCS